LAFAICVGEIRWTRIERADDGGVFGGCQSLFSPDRARDVSWDGALPLESYDRFMITDDPGRGSGVSCRPLSLPSGTVHRDAAPRLRRRIRGLAPTLLGIGMILLVGCPRTNHYLIHPHKAPPEVTVWSGDFARGELRMHLEGARPPGAGPFPTVLVFPEEERTASDMHGVIWDLASRGYVAIAADYERRIEGKYRRTMFAWQSSGDLTLILDATRAYPEVDQNRIGALGFSEGAVVSLLMAAHDPDRVKAVVAYYPITDFPHWYEGKRSGLEDRTLFALARWQLRVESRASDDADFQSKLNLASPLSLAEYVHAPVLFVHGAREALIPPEESERMAARMKASGRTAEVLLVPNGGRFFNFRQPQQATTAWQATLAWFDRYLRPPAQAGG
jgi:dienelactone hydrolase